MPHILDKLVITTVYSATTMYSEANKTMRRTDRPNWALVIKYEGETLYHTGGKVYLSNRHNLVLLPRGVSYDWVCREAGHFISIEFQAELCHPEPLCFQVSDSAPILTAFQALELKRLRQPSVTEMECIRDVYNILLTLSHQSAPRQKAEKLAPALAYISEHYTQEIRNDLLAQAAGLSTVYFRKLFTQVYRTSPINYVKQLRISKAKEMLHSDFGTVTAVAMSLGYANIYDFSRDFKKQTGLSPTAYIRQHTSQENAASLA